MPSNKIKVLVVDDSELIRTLLADALNADRDIDVVGEAKNGLEAVEKSHSLRPDVITLDLIMPDYDGHYALKRIMTERLDHLAVGPPCKGGETNRFGRSEPRSTGSER